MADIADDAWLKPYERPGTAEDDGWLLATCHDDATNESQVVVLDAQDVDAGPIARVHMPRRLPFGFHANWFPADT